MLNIIQIVKLHNIIITFYLFTLPVVLKDLKTIDVKQTNDRGVLTAE